jgi:hypothetical protein
VCMGHFTIWAPRRKKQVPDPSLSSRITQKLRHWYRRSVALGASRHQTEGHLGFAELRVTVMRHSATVLRLEHSVRALPSAAIGA